MKVKLGDVFTIPLGDGRVGVGQVVGLYKKEAYFLAVFDALAAEGVSVSSVVTEVSSAPVRLLALSFDAKIKAGHWTVIANEPVAEDVPLPAYKEAVMTPDHFEAVDYSGSKRRRASKQEVAVLPNRKIVSPMRLERALTRIFRAGPTVHDLGVSTRAGC